MARSWFLEGLHWLWDLTNTDANRQLFVLAREVKPKQLMFYVSTEICRSNPVRPIAHLQSFFLRFGDDRGALRPGCCKSIGDGH